jgi:O-antigen/teichoic acid export membrane protein
MITENIFQLSGTVTLILLGFGIYELVLWSAVTALIIQILYAFIAKRLLPDLRLKPSFAKTGIQEVFSYGIFSTITQILGIIWGEADRFLLGAFVGLSSVAYYNVSKNLSFKITGGIHSAGSVLFPKFSTIRDQKFIQKVFLGSIWIFFCASISIFVPLTILLPDILNLWINPEFSAKGAVVGQVVSASCILRGSFVVYESLFRGLGKPQYITKLIIFTSLTSLATNALLIPKYGLAGAGYAYCITPIWGFITILYTWSRILNTPSIKPMIRTLVVPAVIAIVSFLLAWKLRTHFPLDPTWTEVSFLGFLFFTGTVVLLILSETLTGGQDNHFYSLISYLRSNMFPGKKKI